jgi:hypothetical protein
MFYENYDMKRRLRHLLPTVTCSCRAEAAGCFWKNVYFFPSAFLDLPYNKNTQHFA